MKQNEATHNQQKQEESSFLSFLQADNHYFKFNRLKLETYNHSQDPSPWLDTQRHSTKRQHYNQNPTLLRMPAYRLQLKSHHTQMEIKKKRRFQETMTNYKLNSTFVEFAVHAKSTRNQESFMRANNSRSSEVRTVSRNRLETIKHENEEECKTKTPKIKFLERKFRIKDGTSCGSRIKISAGISGESGGPHTEQSVIRPADNHKTMDQKNLKIRPIHSKQLRSRWFD